GLRRERRSAWQASSPNLVGQGHALMGTPRVGAHPAGARYHGGMDTYLLADAFEVLLRGGGIVLGWILLILGARSGLRRFHRLTSVPLGSGAPVRFCLVDFLALFVLLQIPLLILKLAIDSVGRATPALLFWCGCYSLVYVGLWWWSAASLSAAGISSTLRR